MNTDLSYEQGGSWRESANIIPVDGMEQTILYQVFIPGKHTYFYFLYRQVILRESLQRTRYASTDGGLHRVRVKGNTNVVGFFYGAC